MVQNIADAAVKPLQNKDEITYWENRPFSGGWSDSRCEKSPGVQRTIKKKPKRVRTAYTTEQLRSLERIYNQTKYITSDRRRDIANALKIGDKSVKIWFQNRRMKEKRSSSESDTSSEMSGDISPPPLSPEIKNTEPVVNQTDQNNFYTYQDQVGEYYTYQEPIQFHETQNFTANGMEFYNDNNVYPTQYYPANGDYSTDYYNYYYQNRQENAYGWSTDYATSCQFYS